MIRSVEGSRPGTALCRALSVARVRRRAWTDRLRSCPEPASVPTGRKR